MSWAPILLYLETLKSVKPLECILPGLVLSSLLDQGQCGFNGSLKDEL